MALPTLQSWINQLLPASWQGITFQVEDATFGAGRKLAIHDYPFKDLPYVEDMGLANQVYSFNGYLIGDDCYAQQTALATQLSQGGSGVLVHPSIGAITANLINYVFSINNQRGRMVGVRMTFIQSTSIEFPDLPPNNIISGIYQIFTAINAAIASVKAIASETLAVALAIVNNTVAVVNSVVDFGEQVVNLITNPASVFNSVNGINVLLGSSNVGSTNTVSRYVAGNVGANINPALASVDTTQAPADILTSGTQALLDATMNNRAALNVAVENMTIAAQNVSTNPTDGNNYALFTSIQDMLTAAAAAINDPRDQITLFSSLLNYTGSTYMGTSASAAANQSLNDVVAAMSRRAALFAIARAITAYSPTTTNDVQAIIALVVPLFDAEIVYAGEQSDTATFSAMLSLKSQVVKYLQSEGIGLPSLITIVKNKNLPAKKIAWELYKDATRDTQLIQIVNPTDPGFFPTIFQVPSS